MIPKSLDSITLDDIQALLTNEVQEGKAIEYKRELPGDTHDEKRKLLRAVCSFANTTGGDLIYGIEATDGIPTGVPGIDSTSTDALKLRIESSCRDNIQPRLLQLHLEFVQVCEGRAVLIIRVPKSWSAPHRLSQDGHFYGRNSAGGYQLDVGELRQAFTLSETVAERIRAFRAERLLSIGSNQAPIKMKESGPRVVLHVVPLSAFLGNGGINIDKKRAEISCLIPPGVTSFNTRVNLDGLLNYNFTGSDKPAKAYAQVFRSGVIEAVENHSHSSGQLTVRPGFYESAFTTFLGNSLGLMQQLEIEPPFYVFFALLGVQDHLIEISERYFLDADYAADRDNLILPEVTIEQFDCDPKAIMLPLFEMLFNAFGMARPAGFQ